MQCIVFRINEELPFGPQGSSLLRVLRTTSEAVCRIASLKVGFRNEDSTSIFGNEGIANAETVPVMHDLAPGFRGAQADRNARFLRAPQSLSGCRCGIGKVEKNPNIRVRPIEGPPATNTREDMYSTSFLSGDAAYDIVYCDVIWVPKFAAAGWLLDLTGRPSPADIEDYRSADLRAGSYQGRLVAKHERNS
jgi:hypothetical protein